MEFHFDGAVRKTEKGILAVIQRCFPTAHEVFFSCGDVLLCRDGNAVAILPVTVDGNKTHISSRMRPVKVA